MLKPLKSTTCYSTCRRDLLCVSAHLRSQGKGQRKASVVSAAGVGDCPSSESGRCVSAHRVLRFMWRSLLTLRRQAGGRRRVHEASVSAQGTWAHQFRRITASAVWVEIVGMTARTCSFRRVSQRLHAGQHSRVAWPRASARSHWMLTVRTRHVASATRTEADHAVHTARTRGARFVER